VGDSSTVFKTLSRPLSVLRHSLHLRFVFGADQPWYVIYLPTGSVMHRSSDFGNCVLITIGKLVQYEFKIISNDLCHSTTPTAYGSPFNKIRRSRIASFRATATIAFFLLPQFFSTRRYLYNSTGSCLIAIQEHSTSHDLTLLLPCLVICTWRSFSPME
jgi:hypothetical protein